MRQVARALVVLLVICWPRFAAAANLTLAWDPPSDGVAIGYVIYYGTASHSYTQQVNVGNATSFAVSGLASATTYYFSVRAYDAAGNLSSFSEEVSGMTDRPAVSTVLLTSTSSSPITLGGSVTWNAAATGGLTPYEYQWSVLHNDQWTVGPWMPSSTWAWTPAEASADYLIRVAVRSAGSNSSGEKVETAPFTVLAPAAAAPPPAAPAPPAAPSPPTPPANSCVTPDPFAFMGGGVCYNGGWLPPGMAPPPNNPTPSASASAPAPIAAPAPAAPPGPPAINTCSTPDPFAFMGGGVCYSGGWLPPGMVVPAGGAAPPAPVPAAPAAPAVCATPDPFTAIGGGVCVNGGWRPRMMGGGEN
jgi:hypothetical protein